MTGQRYVPAREAGFPSLFGEWIKEGGRGVSDSLNSLMEIDHVIRVDAEGMVWDDATGVYAPEFEAVTDEDGYFTADTERLLAEDVRRQGWEAEGGWSGQQGTKPGNVIMHTSEFIGGRLAEHILNTPGYWVACAVDVESMECPESVKGCTLFDRCEHCEENGRETEAAGWVVMHRGVGA
ncbi:hypothetical protein [Staphylococcus pasteuri]|uniref:hypothetical protein n=1 Tax=Staphylococcus pasteuri TaxID=45972 RepID=UPI0036FD662A